MEPCLSVVLLFYLLLLVPVADSEQIVSTEIETLLNLTETRVKDIATQALINSQRACDSLAQCTKDTCIRRPCRPQGRHEIQHLQCLAVDHNPDCNVSKSAEVCKSLFIATERSYIRLAPTASETNEEMKKSMCAQKPLEKVLQQIWQQSNQKYQGWSFFGSVEGFLYELPARDYLRPDQCSEYDARLRPWYIQTLAVVKLLYIIVDTTGSMSRQVGPLSPQSAMDTAQAILLQLLNTLTNEDQVAVSDLSGEAIGEPVSVLLSGSQTAQDHPDVISLKQAIRELRSTNSHTDFVASLSNADDFFSRTESSSQVKTLMILSSGQFVSELSSTDLGNVTSHLREQNVVVFFLRLGYDESNDMTLRKMSPSFASMSFDTVTDSDNPLLKLQSYFSFLAWNRFTSLNRSVTWVPVFSDNSGLGNVTTATFPAFDQNMRLLGIAGVDIVTNSFINELGFTFVSKAVSKRVYPPSRLQSVVLPSPISNATTQECVLPGKLNPLCTRLDVKTPMSEFVCCGKCAKKAGKLVTTLVAVIPITLAGAIVAGILLHKRWKKKGVVLPSFLRALVGSVFGSLRKLATKCIRNDRRKTAAATIATTAVPHENSKL